MLSVAASLGSSSPELSAAALAAVAREAYRRDDRQTAAALVAEIRQHYAATWTASHLPEPPPTTQQ